MAVMLQNGKIEKMNRCPKERAISLTKDSIKRAHQASYSHLKARPSPPCLQRLFVVQCKKLIEIIKR